jgi:thiol-disulfide isomerase/thioredoxin
MYVAENNMDFYKLLSDTENEYEKDEDLCMITKNKLTDTHIVLDCSHKFNYLPLSKDMYTRMYLSHEVKCLRGFPLNVNKIECPYCRRITNHILPFLKEEYDVKIYGINSLVKDDAVQEINIPFYDIYKCSVEDCHKYHYAGYLLPFCTKHSSDKKLIKKHKEELKQQFLLQNNMLCKVILKSGIRRGELCNKQCEIGGICKRHKGNIINS